MRSSSIVGVAILSLSTACAVTRDDATAGAPDAIIGGVEAAPDAWPGTVALYGSYRPICGGALVANSWVLTAAHCLNPWQDNGGIGKVVIGRHQLSAGGGETRSVSRFFRHPQLNCNDDGVCDNDIALLQLSSPSAAPKVALIAADQLAAIAPGADTVAVGWGYTSESATEASDVLRQVTVPIISRETCGSFSEYAAHLTGNMICTNSPTAAMGSCRIDSGSPLFMTIGDKTVQVGLTSWGRSCAGPQSPTVYARIANYIEWMTRTSGGAIRP